MKALVAVVVVAAVATAGYLLVDDVFETDEPEPGGSSGGGMVIRALGDSVTAGFGYGDEDSSPFSFAELPFCVLRPGHRRCQDPDGVAYPARFAAQVPDADFRNFAVSGSTPADWLGVSTEDRELSARLHARLAAVIAADPDVTVLTLGANPLLTSFLAGRDRYCAMRNEAEVHRCVARALDDQHVVSRLEDIYVALLDTPPDGRNGLVVVFQYPETHPASAIGAHVTVLIMALREAIERAVAGVEQQHPEWSERLVEAEPGPFLAHGCDAEEPWILKIDTCVHPNAAGHAQLAAVLERLVLEQPSAASGSTDPEPEQFAEPGTSCGVFVDHSGRWAQASELKLGVTHGRRGCDEIVSLVERYIRREPSCTIANGADGCTLEFNRWLCQRAPGVWMHPANFTCESKEDGDSVLDVVGLYAAETAPTIAQYHCGNSNEGGGPFHVRANFDCEAAMQVAASYDHKFGFLCHTETTGLESSYTVCTLDAARVEWANGA